MSVLDQVKSSGQTFVVKPGDALYDGKVESVRMATASTSAAVVFSHVRRVKTKNVVRELTSPVTVEQL